MSCLRFLWTLVQWVLRRIHTCFIFAAYSYYSNVINWSGSARWFRQKTFDQYVKITKYICIILIEYWNILQKFPCKTSTVWISLGSFARLKAISIVLKTQKRLRIAPLIHKKQLYIYLKFFLLLIRTDSRKKRLAKVYKKKVRVRSLVFRVSVLSAILFLCENSFFTNFGQKAKE